MYVFVVLHVCLYQCLCMCLLCYMYVFVSECLCYICSYIYKKCGIECMISVPVTSSNGVCGAHVRLVDDGAHGLVLVVRADNLDDLGDVAYAKELVCVEKLALSIMGEVRCENAVRCTLSALVLACSASLGGAVAISCC